MFWGMFVYGEWLNFMIIPGGLIWREYDRNL